MLNLNLNLITQLILLKNNNKKGSGVSRAAKHGYKTMSQKRRTMVLATAFWGHKVVH